MTQTRASERNSFWQTINRSTIALLVLQLMSGMILAPHLTFFPIYVKDLGYSTVVIANMAAAKLIAGLIASMIGGTLSDSIGRKYTLLLGNIGYLLSSFVFFVVSPEWIGVLWVIGGLGLGLHTLGGQSYLIDAAVPEFLGLTSALFNWGYTLGGVLSSPIAGYLLDHWDYGIFAITLVAFSLLTIAVNQFVLPRSPVERVAQTTSLKSLFGYGDIATRPAIWILTAIRFLPTLYYAIMLILIPLLLDAAGASKTTIAWYATLSWIAASLAQAGVGVAADRWGPKRSTALAFVSLLVSILGIGLWPDGLWVVFTFGTVGIAAAWSLSTLLPSLVAQVSVPEDRGRILGFIHLWWNLAMVIGSLVGGALFEIASGLPFLIAGVANIGGLGLLFLFFSRIPRSRSL
jgi:MFS family permease